MDEMTIVLLAAPVVVIQLVLMVVNLLNLNKKKTVRYLTRTVWLLIIVIGGLIGNIVYMVVENDRHDGNKD
jgi:ABC-type nickel/cobalt efflux system permease component RcnA